MQRWEERMGNPDPGLAARQRAVAYWLIAIAAMVYAMVILGGVTRLTYSGLSMVEWKPLTGWLPPMSDAAWEEALSITRIAGSSLLAVSVARDDSAVTRTEATLQRLREAAARAGISLETQMLQGRPFEAILNAAAMKQVDLIILGSHGRTGLKRLLLGSVAERVIGLASCPVLVVKRK